MNYSSVDALVISHPGHELRVHGWLASVRPVTYVLTDGSGATGIGRLDSTDAILREAGAVRSLVVTPMRDADAYAAIRNHDSSRFVELATAIARDLVERGITAVAGDGAEGYNPMHDVCRLMIDAAVILASRRAGREIESWWFPLVGAPDCPSSVGESRRRVLDDRELARKISAAETYRALAPDVVTAFRDYGKEAFRMEEFGRASQPSWFDDRFLGEQPFYELHGDERVRAGKYATVIRYREHIQPIAEALKQLAESA